MTSIKQLLDTKGRDVLAIGPDDTVFDVIKKMADHNVGSLVGLDGKHLIGMITERN